MTETDARDAAQDSGACRFAACLERSPGLSPAAEYLASLLKRTPAASRSLAADGVAMVTWTGASHVRARCGAIVAFSGDISWTDRDLAALSEAAGHGEALAAGYSRDGVAVLRHVHGPFALAIFDPAKRTALAAIDRMGIRSLCYSASDDRIVLGGEVQQVAAHPRVGAQIDPQGVYDYLFCHVVPAPRTIYRDVQKLLPAQYLHWCDGRLETGFYWALPYAARAGASVRELEARFLELVENSVAHAAAGCARVAAFLSGGTDSSTVTGMLGRVRGAPPEAYSIGFRADGFDEMEYARIAARHFGARHHPYYVTPADVRDMIPRVAAAYDEPFGNASAVPAYFCARQARDDGIERLLAGDGGDELFGGNARYAKQKVFEAYWRVPAPLRQHLIEPLLLSLGADSKIAPMRKAASYVRQARIPLPDRLESYNFLVREASTALFTTEFLSAIDTDAPAVTSREVYGRTASMSPVDRMMHLDLKLTLADNDLRKVNRMCELAGVQVRYPLLDEALADFSGGVPADLKVKGLKLRYFFKHALRDFLPPETIAKSKQGFGLPFGIWLQEDDGLLELTRQSLKSFRGRGYVRPEYIDTLLRRHGSEHASYYGVMVWVIVMLEQWLATHRH